MSKEIYNIPAGIPFAKALAAELLRRNEGAPEALADIRLFLPSRRACRTMREAFLYLSGGKPLMLPRMLSLGDVDEEELSLSIAGQADAESALELPPAISPLRRQILLAKTIQALPGFAQNFDHALGLATALGRLMDQIHTEGLDLEDLHRLVPEDFAEHWQITIDFLKILSRHWPDILKEHGMIDGSQRRDMLLRALAGHWQTHPPPYPVIAAGSTGSIPATALLLSAIAELPQGCVILPSYDADLDAESWDALEEHHPQYGFRQLLERMQVARTDIRLWPHEDHDTGAARRVLAREIMRPAATTLEWQKLGTAPQTRTRLARALKDMDIISCAHQREEAQVIAVLMRGALEEPGRTATLITPDRNLARRVASACARWGIAVDDSAGKSLAQTTLGSFIRLSLEVFLTRVGPISLLALLKHPLCRLGLRPEEKAQSVSDLDYALRGSKPGPGLEGIKTRLQAQKHPEKHGKILQDLEPILNRFTFGSKPENPAQFKSIVKGHLQLLELLSTHFDTNSFDTLWSGEEGEAASGFFSEILDHAALMPDMNLPTYTAVLEHMMQSITIRPAYGTHPRLQILGQIEARLVESDIIIMAGLNEGTWPPEAGHDPWMSRPMRRDFGLPLPERSTGLAAHDFVQGLCAPRVIITRAKRAGNAPSVPSRWLQRLETVLEAAQVAHDPLYASPAASWAAQMDEALRPVPALRPAPSPPVSLRPRKLSATRIETWLKDPYSIYARYILNLKKLDPLEKPIDAAALGTLMHEILERFVKAHPVDIPGDAPEILRNIAAGVLKESGESQESWNFWWPRFEQVIPAYLTHEKTWRQDHSFLQGESYGESALSAPAGNFTVSAIADRIDTGTDGLAVIDYKTGGNFTQKGLTNGAQPQLPIEALILSEGGFAGIKRSSVSYIGYWSLKGGTQPFKTVEKQGDITGIIEHTRAGLGTLITVFDDPQTPYIALPRPDNIPAYNDYEHLSRVKEWSVLSDSDEAGEAA